MKFYNNSYTSNYQELLTYYPRYYWDINEMQAILKYFGGLCDDMEAQTERVYCNNFILGADLETTASWEEALGITDTDGLSLDQRRRVVLGRVSGSGHIGEPEIRVLVSVYTKDPVTVDFAEGLITILVGGQLFSHVNLLSTLLQRIPAHLALKMMVQITMPQDTLYTGGLMASVTRLCIPAAT